MGKLPDFNFMATGIGSVPSTDIPETCNNILLNLPEIPFWPQFVKRSYLEDMNIQFSEGLSFLKIDHDKKSITSLSENMESELTTFYDRFMTDDIDAFRISEQFAPGLYALIQLISSAPEKYGPFIKGQTVGPITFAAAVSDREGKSVLYNPDLLDALVKGLAIKALWQVRQLSRSGKKIIIFLDEPYLSGFGSAFTPIQRHEVISLLKEVIDYLREKSDAMIGIHCCGNSDWPMIIEANPDIINFDAYGFMENFLLYPDDLTGFLKNGGIIAWGIVPTSDFSENEKVDGLHLKLNAGLEGLYEWGLDRDLIFRQSIITPACGMGTMEQRHADSVIELLSGLSKKMKKTE